MGGRDERLARNEALFRVVNERVREVRPEEGEEETGFLCECGDEACTETIRLSVREYERIRSDPTLFFVAPGHEIPSVEDIIERNERYVVVRKKPEEASIALDTDPRSDSK
jgi:hypothetical protein